MDEATILEDFDKLEARLDSLVTAREALVAENAELAERVRTLENRLEEKAGAENRLNQERDLVRSRIDALLSKLGEPETG